MKNKTLVNRRNAQHRIQSSGFIQQDAYPNIYFLLKVLYTLTVSTTTPEHMFSSLKRI